MESKSSHSGSDGSALVVAVRRDIDVGTSRLFPFLLCDFASHHLRLFDGWSQICCCAFSEHDFQRGHTASTILRQKILKTVLLSQDIKDVLKCGEFSKEDRKETSQFLCIQMSVWKV